MRERDNEKNPFNELNRNNEVCNGLNNDMETNCTRKSFLDIGMQLLSKYEINLTEIAIEVYVKVPP